MSNPAFIDQLVDWREFEKFVGRLSDDPNVLVEHDVTEAGRSGANRQIDVKLTHKIGDITYVTVIECKRWKEKVDRQRIDVLAATLEDLRASKGVLFTTSGFEKGAEDYARDKGIELFVVRDLTDEEWGLPGRVVSFWWQTYAEFGRFAFNTPQLVAIVDKSPTSVNFNIRIEKDAAHDEGLRLHSIVDGEPGPNLMALLLDARTRALDLLAKEGKIFGGQREEAERFLLMPIRLDLTEFDTRQLLRNYGGVRLSVIDVELVVQVSQKRFEHDRGHDLDFALAVENYLTRSRRVVTSRHGQEELSRFELSADQATVEPDEVISDDKLLCVFTEPWVSIPKPIRDLYPTRKLTFRLPSWSVSSSDPPVNTAEARARAFFRTDNRTPDLGSRMWLKSTVRHAELLHDGYTSG